MLLVARFLDSKAHDVVGLIYSSVYLALGIVDVVTVLVTLRKLARYNIEKMLAPEMNIRVRGLDCLKWFSVLSILFYVFMTVTFYINLKSMRKVYVLETDIT